MQRVVEPVRPLYLGVEEAYSELCDVNEEEAEVVPLRRNSIVGVEE
jgi:hypothetical protein